MSCEIIQISALAAKRIKEAPDALTDYRAERIARREAKLLELTTAPETLTETCRNSRLRLSRREAWWKARRLTDFARACMDWHSALSCAQSWNVPGAKLYPESDDDEAQGTHVSRWRAALIAQMLTPAPTVGDVQWKRVQLRSEQHQFTGVPGEKLQRAIDTDVEWLAAHPVRQSNRRGQS
jgi:hypothetical protein